MKEKYNNMLVIIKSMDYLHSLDLDDWYSCYNISLKGIMYSAEIVNKTIPQSDFMNEDPIIKMVTSTPTPSGKLVLMNEDEKRSCVEVEFERVRQKNYNHLPSRLNCLWIAEDTPEGRDMLVNMFGEGSNRRIMNVSLLPISKVHKADKRWYEKYYEENKEEYIENYWEGVAYDNIPRWELLVKGGFKIDKADILFLREHCLRHHAYQLGEGFMEASYKINDTNKL